MNDKKIFFFVSLLLLLLSAAPSFAADMAGVWLATVTVNKVGEVNNTAAGPTATGVGFPLRLLLHVDATGAVRLLKEVIIMNDAATSKTVVLADSELITSAYSGAVLRGSTMVGLRASAVGYDFSGSSTNCAGGLNSSGTVTCAFTLLPADATNPFLHRFHPDHDNLNDARTAPFIEAYQVVRGMKLAFAGRYPANPDEPALSGASIPPGWGTTDLGGTYGETFDGLHKQTLTVAGWFTMKKVAAIADLRK